MGGPWREPPIARSHLPATRSVAHARVENARNATEAVTAAVVGFVVALVTSLGVSLACVAYLRW